MELLVTDQSNVHPVQSVYLYHGSVYHVPVHEFVNLLTFLSYRISRLAVIAMKFLLSTPRGTTMLTSITPNDHRLPGMRPISFQGDLQNIPTIELEPSEHLYSIDQSVFIDRRCVYYNDDISVREERGLGR